MFNLSCSKSRATSWPSWPAWKTGLVERHRPRSAVKLNAAIRTSLSSGLSSGPRLSPSCCWRRRGGGGNGRAAGPDRAAGHSAEGDDPGEGRCAALQRWPAEGERTAPPPSQCARTTLWWKHQVQCWWGSAVTSCCPTCRTVHSPSLRIPPVFLLYHNGLKSKPAAAQVCAWLSCRSHDLLHQVWHCSSCSCWLLTNQDLVND